MRFPPVRFAFMLAALAAVPASAQEKTAPLTPAARALFARVLARYKDMQTLRYTASGQFGFALGQGSIRAATESVVVLARQNRFSLETSITPPGQRKSRGIVKCDGKTIWEYDPAANTYTELPCGSSFPPAENSDWAFQHTGLDPSLPFFLGLTKGGVLQALADARDDGTPLPAPQHLSGQPIYVADLPMPFAGETEQTSCTVMVDGTTFTVTRCALKVGEEESKANRGGRAPLSALLSTSYSGVRINAPVDDRPFTFTPPPGARKVDHMQSVFDRVMVPLMEEMDKQTRQPPNEPASPSP